MRYALTNRILFFSIAILAAVFGFSPERASASNSYFDFYQDAKLEDGFLKIYFRYKSKSGLTGGTLVYGVFPAVNGVFPDSELRLHSPSTAFSGVNGTSSNATYPGKTWGDGACAGPASSAFSLSTEYEQWFSQVWDANLGDYRSASSLTTSDVLHIVGYLNQTQCNWENRTYFSTKWTDSEKYPITTGGPTISLEYPPNSTSTADFPQFIINYEIAEPYPNGIFACVSYGTSSDPGEMEHQDCESVVNTAGAHGRAIIKRSLLENGTHYAQAQLYQNVNCPQIGPCQNSLLSTSDVNEFTITGPYVPSSYWGAPTSTATSSEWVLTCDNVSGLFSNSLCSVLVYLFIPKSSDFTRWSDLKSELDTKPPFGYFSSFSEAISELSTSSTSSIAFADLSTLDTSLFDRFKTGFSWVLWVMFGFWGFQKLREIQL